MKDYLATSYDRYADKYDDTFRVLQYEKFRTLINPYREILEGKKLVDIGCGTGLLADYLKEETLLTDVVGLDISFKMLVAAKEKGNEKLVQADMYHLPLKNDIADIVSSFTVVNIYPDQEDAVIGEMARLLKPGGFLILSVLERGFSEGLPLIMNKRGLNIKDMKVAGQDIGIVCFKG